MSKKARKIRIVKIESEYWEIDGKERHQTRAAIQYLGETLLGLDGPVVLEFDGEAEISAYEKKSFSLMAGLYNKQFVFSPQPMKTIVLQKVDYDLWTIDGGSPMNISGNGNDGIYIGLFNKLRDLDGPAQLQIEVVDGVTLYPREQQSFKHSVAIHNKRFERDDGETRHKNPGHMPEYR